MAAAIEIPYDKLGISDAHRRNVDPASPKPMRLATARGVLPIPPDQLLPLLTVLVGDADEEVRKAAVETAKKLPNPVSFLGQRTHAKILEMLAQLRPERELDERILTIRGANDRTAMLIAARADGRLCEMISTNHERLLITPDILLALYDNPACSEADFERANAFLRMEGASPALPGPRGTGLKALGPKPVKAPAPATPVAAGVAGGAAGGGSAGALTPQPVKPVAPAFDLEAEIEAALSGRVSPLLEAKAKLEMFDLGEAKPLDGAMSGFNFEFRSDDDFSMELLEDGGSGGADPDNETKLSIAKQISMMSPGKKIKLAYLGNKESRNILIRDRNKQVALAVIKSGRLTDNEVLKHSGDRNLPSDVLREIGSNGEWLRKYPVKVALVNNPRCPPSIAVALVSQLQSKDLSALGRNKNVSAVIFQMAQKLAKARGPG